MHQRVSTHSQRNSLRRVRALRQVNLLDRVNSFFRVVSPRRVDCLLRVRTARHLTLLSQLGSPRQAHLTHRAGLRIQRNLRSRGRSSKRIAFISQNSRPFARSIHRRRPLARSRRPSAAQLQHPKSPLCRGRRAAMRQAAVAGSSRPSWRSSQEPWSFLRSHSCCCASCSIIGDPRLYLNAQKCPTLGRPNPTSS